MPNTGRTPSLAIYRYKITASYVLDGNKYSIDNENINSLVIDYDFDTNNMPLIYMIANLSSRMVDMIIKNKDKGVFILNIQKATIDSITQDLWKDYINDTFIYFTEEDTSRVNTRNYSENKREKDPKYDDLYREIVIGLMSQKLVNSNMRTVTGMVDCPNMQSLAIYALGNDRPLVIEPFTNNVEIKGLMMPPSNTKAKSLKFLNKISTFYNYDYLYFMDFDRTYLLSREGKLVPRKGDPINTIMITLKDEFDVDNSSDPSIRSDGMYIDTAAKMARINVIGTSVELADYRDDTKMYTNIKSSKTIGGETEMEKYSTSGGVNFAKKTMTVRAPNDNISFITNRERVSNVYISFNKNDLDTSVLTPNKEYRLSTKELYPDKDYDGKYIIRSRKELFYRSSDGGSAEQFICNTQLLLEKSYEG